MGVNCKVFNDLGKWGVGCKVFNELGKWGVNLQSTSCFII